MHWFTSHAAQCIEARATLRKPLTIPTVQGILSSSNSIIWRLCLDYLESDPLEELCQDGEVEDDWRGEEGVLAGVVDDEGVVAAHSDLGGVLVHRPLAVAHGRDVLDYHL